MAAGVRKTLAEFKREGFIQHGGYYTYDKVVYTNSMTKVLITCRTHGNFLQLPANHLYGFGCKKCASKKHSESIKSKNYDKLSDKLTDLSNDTCTLSFLDTVGSGAVVRITCNIHGVSEKAYGNLGKNPIVCKKCAAEQAATNNKSILEYIPEFRDTHGNLYDYSQTEFSRITGNTSKVPIRCRVEGHGTFWQQVNNHRNGQGCPKCGDISRQRNYIDKPTTLYYVRFDTSPPLYKLGITTYPVKVRFAGETLGYTILTTKHYPSGYEAYKNEQRILEMYKQYKYDGPDLIRGGNSELFTADVLKGEYGLL